MHLPVENTRHDIPADVDIVFSMMWLKLLNACISRLKALCLALLCGVQ